MRVLIGSRIRSQTAYRTSFWLTVATSVGVGLIEFIEIYVILTNVPVFGGLSFAQAALVFALANMGFSLADMVFGQFDSMPSNLRLGRLEVMLVRPLPLIVQFVTADFQLRRLGRVAVGLVIMIIALRFLDLSFTPADPLPADHHPVRRRGDLRRPVRDGRRSPVLRDRRC